jgi:menaquinone-dependent protoporphyrinogen IX oxidase
MKTLMIIGIGIILVVLMALGAVAFISYDMGNRATVSETLNPNGTMVGNALVVYDPSITGNTKNVAGLIASDLQTRGYKVELVGIKSVKAGNTSDYNIIVVGGPIYGGNASDAVKKYLETLKPIESTKISVFATGGPHTTDEAMIKKQIAPIPENSTLQINAFMAVAMNDDKTKKCAVFVDNLLK